MTSHLSMTPAPEVQVEKSINGFAHESEGTVEIIPPVRLEDFPAKIKEAYAAGLKGFRTGMEKMIEVGALLRQAKTLVKHGEWLDWVKDNCGFTARTAQLYMSLSEYLELMPDLKETVLDQCMNVALPHLRERYYSRVNNHNHDTASLGTAFLNYMYNAHELLAEIRVAMGDEGWANYLACLTEEQKMLVEGFLGSSQPIFLPNEFLRHAIDPRFPMRNDPEENDEAEDREIRRLEDKQERAQAQQGLAESKIKKARKARNAKSRTK